jgi:hypothetical protein
MVTHGGMASLHHTVDDVLARGAVPAGAWVGVPLQRPGLIQNVGRQHMRDVRLCMLLPLASGVRQMPHDTLQYTLS